MLSLRLHTDSAFCEPGCKDLHACSKEEARRLTVRVNVYKDETLFRGSPVALIGNVMPLSCGTGLALWGHIWLLRTSGGINTS